MLPAMPKFQQHNEKLQLHINKVRIAFPLQLTSGNLEGWGPDWGGAPVRQKPGSLFCLLHWGGQLIKLAVAALQSGLARHQFSHMLPEVALAGLDCQVSSLQSCPLLCGPAFNRGRG